MALYRLRKWITQSINGNKINIFFQGSLSGTERCDSWHLLSYRYSLSCLFTFSPSISCTTLSLSLSLAHSEWVARNELPYMKTVLPTAREGQCVVRKFTQGWVSRACFSNIITSLKCVSSFESHSSQKFKCNYFLAQYWSQYKVQVCHIKSITWEWCTAVSSWVGHISNYPQFEKVSQ